MSVPTATPSVPRSAETGAQRPARDSDVRRTRTAELIRRARETSGAERDQLLDQVIVLNIPVAHALAGRYRNRGQSLEELQQVACLALTRAVRAYDAERGDDLLVYVVPSILGELKRYFRDSSWAVRPPRRIQELRPRLVEAVELLTQVLRREPTAAELAVELDCSVRDVEEAVACGELGRTTSLDDQGSENGLALVDLLSSDEPGFDHSDAVAILGPACRRLPHRDRWILRMRFYDQMTQQEIAEELGVTQVQVSRLLARIIKQMRKEIGSEPLRAPAA